MSIAKEDIEYVVNLARLELKEYEIDDFLDKFNSILKYVEKIKELDLDDVEPTYHVHSVKNVFRDDILKPSYDRTNLLMNAGDTADGYIRISF